jgi:regulatory protein YycI of two-component signal transduction system YycFG
MINILTTIAGVFIVMLLIAPIILLTILIIRTSKKPPVVNTDRIDALEQNDNIIVEDVNAALTELLTRITELEEKIEREEQTIKGFGGKK